MTRWRGAVARCWRRAPPCRRDPGRRRPATPPTPAARRAAAAQWTPAAGPAPGARRCSIAPPSRSPVSAAGVSKWIRNKKKDGFIIQCCGNGTGTAGTVTFCHSGTGTGMHYCSGSGTGFRSGSNIKCNKKVKINNERPTS